MERLPTVHQGVRKDATAFKILRATRLVGRDIMPCSMARRFLLALLFLLLFGGCKQKTEQGRFSAFQAQKDGRPLFAIIDMSLREEKTMAAFPWYLDISTQLTDPTADGLPKEQEESALNDWEDSLEKEIATECRFVYVGRVTWNGARILLYYVDKPDAVVAKLRNIANGHPSRTFRIDSVFDQKWKRVSEYFEAAR